MKWHKTQTPGVRYRLNGKGERRYYIDYTDGSGARRQQAVEGDYTEAKLALARAKDKVSTGETLATRSSVRVKEYGEAWLEREKGRLAQNSSTCYANRLKLYVYPAIGGKRVSDVTKFDIVAIIRKCEAKGMAPSSIHNLLAIIGGLFKAAVWEGIIAVNPVAQLAGSGARPKLTTKAMHVLPPEGIQKLLAEAEKRRWPRWLRPILALALYSGGRQSELLGLRWGDLDLRADVPTVTFRRQAYERRVIEQLKAKKVGEERTVPLPRAVAKLLIEWRLASQFDGDDDWVFATGRGTPIGNSYLRARYKACCEAAKIEPLRFHDLRHTCASLLIASGASYIEVKEHLGHAQATITLNTYSHLWEKVASRERVFKILEAAV